MQRSDIPAKFPIPFANAAGGAFIRPIPEASQISIEAGAASLTDGFPPVTFDPVGAGGVPPFGQDFNGLLNQVTLWLQWQAAGGTAIYDASFSTAIGGYPQGATLGAASVPGQFWTSLVDNNVTNPDTGGAGWQKLDGPSAANTVRANLTGGAAAPLDVTLPSLATALGFSTSIGAQVSVTLPGGVIKKSGLTAVIGNGVSGSTTFSSAFPTACLCVVACYANSTSTSQAIQGNPLNVHSQDAVGFAIYNGGSASAQYFWEATGY